MVKVQRSAAPPKAEEKPYLRFGGVFLDFFRYRGLESVLEGPADTGKSRGCLELLHAACEKYPGARAVIVRKTRASITETAMQTYERWVRPDGASRLWHDLEYRYPNGSVIVLAGLDEPTRLLSSEFDLVYVMQAEEVDEDEWEILTTRVTGRGATMPYVRLFADMNPTFPDFHLYRREAAGKVRFFQVRHADNPTVTPERLEPLKNLTGYRLRRLYYGERVAAEGMYFEEWNPDVHVCEPFDIPREWPRWLAVDYGFAAPFCCLWFARDPESKRIYVYRELYATGLRDEQQAQLIAARSEGERVVRRVADPSMFAQRKEEGKPSIAYVYGENGVVVQPASNQRIAGWNAVRRALAADDGPPRLQVVGRACPNLVRTIPKMVVDPLDPEDVADAVDRKKTEDHAVDALRYGLMSEGRDVPPVHGTVRRLAEDAEAKQRSAARAFFGRGVDPRKGPVVGRNGVGRY